MIGMHYHAQLFIGCDGVSLGGPLDLHLLSREDYRYEYHTFPSVGKDQAAREGGWEELPCIVSPLSNAYTEANSEHP
jgi:hypothetical protein